MDSSICCRACRRISFRLGFSGPRTGAIGVISSKLVGVGTHAYGLSASSSKAIGTKAQSSPAIGPFWQGCWSARSVVVVEVNGYEIGPGAELSGAFLVEVDLSGIDLTGANLSGAALGGANLTGANLTGANLTGAALPGVNLTGANLTGANLTGATAHGVYLNGANLSGATLDGAALSGMSDDADTVWPEGFASGAFRRLTRHQLHYDFCHKALPKVVFGPSVEAVSFIGTLRMGSGSEALSEYWNALSGEFQDLRTMPQDFDLATRSIANTGWNATVITPPPALEANEAHQIGVLNNVERVGHFRYVCLERDASDPDKAHIGEWFSSGDRKNLGHVTVPSVNTMFEVIEILTTGE